MLVVTLRTVLAYPDWHIWLFVAVEIISPGVHAVSGKGPFARQPDVFVCTPQRGAAAEGGAAVLLEGADVPHALKARTRSIIITLNVETIVFIYFPPFPPS